MEIAERIRSGMTAVNGVITFMAVPSLPFGGVGDSGFGRIHGADGLQASSPMPRRSPGSGSSR